MENIVRIEELAGFVEQTLNEIRTGVAKARQTGLLAELPDQVDFNVTLVKEFAALEDRDTQTSETTQSDGGMTREVTKGSENSTQDRTGTSKQTEATAGQDVTDTTGSETSESNETRTGNDTVTATETGNRTGSGRDENQNAHNQTTSSETSYTQ